MYSQHDYVYMHTRNQITVRNEVKIGNWTFKCGAIVGVLDKSISLQYIHLVRSSTKIDTVYLSFRFRIKLF